MTFDLANQQLTRYLQLVGEDTEILNTNRTQFEAILAECYAMEGVKPDLSPDHWADMDIDAYFTQVNQKIDELSPPLTFEHRVKRFLYATTAAFVFNEYKYPNDFEDLLQASSQRALIMNAWQAGHPGPTGVRPNRIDSDTTPPRTPSLLTPPSSHRSGGAKRLSTEDVEQCLRNPEQLFGKTLVYTPPPGTDEECMDFSVIGSSVRMGDDGVVERGYEILGDRLVIPCNEGDLRHFLMHSTYYV